MRGKSMKMEMVTVREASRLLKIKKSTISKRIERGLIKAVKIDDLIWVIPVKELDRITPARHYISLKEKAAAQ